MRRFGADAVIVFFVLSGYVIAYVSAERERTLSEYAINRCAGRMRLFDRLQMA